jgi:hypothetical protein
MTKYIVYSVVVAVACLTACRHSYAQEESEVPQQAAQKDRAQKDPAEQEPVKPKAPEPKLDQAKLEKKFGEALSGATLVGHFTMGDNAGEPKEERYVINKVTKLKGDYWLFTARIQYGKKDLTVPMMLPVKWAGDTAVITVTDLGIPGMGTYTARVLIYGDQYAGTWSGGKRGGHLWGRIERGLDDGPKESDRAEEAAADNPAEPAKDAPDGAKQE